MKPVTRKEMFMEALAKGCACDVEPVTREEKFLAAQAEREASGGSGGSGGVDMYICCDKNNPKVISGSHSNVVEKMRAGLPPVIIKMLYEMNDAGDDGQIDAYGVYLANNVLYREQDGRWYVEVEGETSDDAFRVYEDNTVEYFDWS